MQKSESIKELATALSKFQGELKPAIKDEINPFFKSRYADLAGVWEAIREPLSKNGLSVAQLPYIENDKTILTTLLLHISGEWLSSDIAITPVKLNDPQAMGSAITYSRRYSLGALLGVAAEEDDDAEEATDRKKEPESKVAEHFCFVHDTPFFKKGNMRSFAHPVGIGGKDWCHEHATKKRELSALAQAEKDIDEFFPEKPQPAKPVEAPTPRLVASPGASEAVSPDKPPTDREVWLRDNFSKAEWMERTALSWLMSERKVSSTRKDTLAGIVNKLSNEDWLAFEAKINSRIEAAGK